MQKEVIWVIVDFTDRLVSLIQSWLHFHILNLDKVNNRLLIRVLEVRVVHCLTWEFLVGSQWVYCMAVLVLGNFYNTKLYCLSEVTYNNIYNQMQNIWNKLKKSSKTGQDKKSLISTFACFLTATANV